MAIGFEERTGIKVVLLILFILILIIGGAVWFDYLGILNVKEVAAPIISPISSRFGIGEDLPKPVENIEDANLLEIERLNKRQQAIDLKEAELTLREENIENKEAEIKQMLASLNEREEAYKEKEKSFNDRLKEYDNRSTNLKQSAEYFAGMVPEAAVAMFLEMDDQDIIDIMRMHEKLCKEAGTMSLVSYWLSKMPADRAATLNRKMIKKPES